MHSLEQAFAVLGDVAIADRLEKVAFNALPGTLTDDMWAHQYDQQSNQVRCDKRERQWSTNGPDSNVFGLEPNFGCCTANYHQGWPKLVSSTWMRTQKGGLAAAVYGPNIVRTIVSGDVPIEIEQQTNYPYSRVCDYGGPAETKVQFRVALADPRVGARSHVVGKWQDEPGNHTRKVRNCRPRVGPRGSSGDFASHEASYHEMVSAVRCG